MSIELRTSVQFLKGVGEKRAALYHKLEIDTVEDLLYHVPRDYLDLSHWQEIASSPVGEVVTVRATVMRKGGEQRIRKGMSLFKVTVADESGEMLLTFYNTKFTVEALDVGEEYLFHGRCGGTLLRREISAPQVYPISAAGALMPIYPLTAGITSRSIGGTVTRALELVEERLEDPLPMSLRQRLGLCHIQYALEKVHHPSSWKEAALARRRLIFEELFTLSIALSWVREKREEEQAVQLQPVNPDSFYASLPFVPTGAQRRAIAQVGEDLTANRPMNRLVQGDVGSGKTLVAAAAAWMAAQNGVQSALMVPTEILAEQHRATLERLLGEAGVRVGLLTGSQKAKEKRQIKEALADGKLDLVVGTHALLSQGIEFANLGLVITDEQHRFGVGQRIALGKKGEAPHTLVMSATPIPRTLALMIYGDLDLSVIDEMPAGRRPVKTYRISSAKRQDCFGFIRQHLDRGRQAYIVCPLVETGEVDLGLTPATDYAEDIANGPFRGYRVGLLHGKMKAADKERAMREFLAGDIQLLVATTVIEVGVDVPNAVILLVENAERFGLSQLHQLRGRVGRGKEQSYCFLLSDSRGEEAKTRLSTMCHTASGFTVAEQDLALRGPGDFFGNRQHGLPQLRIADMAKDMELLELAQQTARALLTEDPLLELPDHQALQKRVESMLSSIGERPN